VRGKAVAVNVACWSYESRGALCAYFEDPEPRSEGLELDISRGDFGINYYAPVVDLLRFAERDGRGRDVNIFTLPGLDLRLALHPELDAVIRDGDHMEDWLEILPDTHGLSVNEVHLGPDGIALLPGDSWLRREYEK